MNDMDNNKKYSELDILIIFVKCYIEYLDRKIKKYKNPNYEPPVSMVTSARIWADETERINEAMNGNLLKAVNYIPKERNTDYDLLEVYLDNVEDSLKTKIDKFMYAVLNGLAVERNGEILEAKDYVMLERHRLKLYLAELEGDFFDGIYNYFDVRRNRIYANRVKYLLGKVEMFTEKLDAIIPDIEEKINNKFKDISIGLDEAEKEITRIEEEFNSLENPENEIIYLTGLIAQLKSVNIPVCQDYLSNRSTQATVCELVSRSLEVCSHSNKVWADLWEAKKNCLPVEKLPVETTEPKHAFDVKDILVNDTKNSFMCCVVLGLKDDGYFTSFNNMPMFIPFADESKWKKVGTYCVDDKAINRIFNHCMNNRKNAKNKKK